MKIGLFLIVVGGVVTVTALDDVPDKDPSDKMGILTLDSESFQDEMAEQELFRKGCKAGKACRRRNGKCIDSSEVCNGRVVQGCAARCVCCVMDVSTTLITTAEDLTTSSPDIPNTGCPVRFVDVAGGCYVFNIAYGLPRRSWSEARSFCQSMSTEDYFVDLAVLGNFSAPQDDPVLNYMNSQGMWYTWFGASYNSTDNTWTWLDGRTIATNSSMWSPGQPNDEGNSICGVFGRNNLPYFTLFDNPCSWKRDYACQIVA